MGTCGDICGGGDDGEVMVIYNSDISVKRMLVKVLEEAAKETMTVQFFPDNLPHKHD